MPESLIDADVGRDRIEHWNWRADQRSDREMRCHDCGITWHRWWPYRESVPEWVCGECGVGRPLRPERRTK